MYENFFLCEEKLLISLIQYQVDIQADYCKWVIQQFCFGSSTCFHFSKALKFLRIKGCCCHQLFW